MPADRDHEVSTILTAMVDLPESDAGFELTVTEGDSIGAKIVVDAASPSRILVGTGPVCHFRVGDRQVSRRHFAAELLGDKLRITDLDSTNGTFVNGVRIVSAFAAGGDSILAASTRFHVERLPSNELRAPAARPQKTSKQPGRNDAPAGAFGRTVGDSEPMRKLYPMLERLSSADVSVLIEGETGTGKEVLAESMHERSARSSGPFVVFDCTAVPPNLIESELFGHERGAFTGAVNSRAGVFEQASGGTLLIDEIGDLDLSLQPKLLRALERGEVRRVGGDRTIRVDVRILSATRRDLDREVTLGRFRDDLFHRLVVTRVELPPLRRRHGDIRLLCAQFCKQLGTTAAVLPPELLQRWEEYAWPGNVRELRNAVARYVALGELAASHGGPESNATAGQGSGPGLDSAQSFDLFDQVLAMRLPIDAARQRVILEFEARYVEQVLADNGGNVARAAEASGIARRHFQRIRARANTARGE